MKSNRSKNIFCMTGLAIIILIMASCSKMDDFKKFVKAGERVYPATFDSLQVLPGKDRVMLTGLLTGDPGVTKYRVFWNNGSDSLESPVVRTDSVYRLRQLIDGLPEGPMTFEIRTYNADGDRSIPMTVMGDVYGEDFQNAVNLRGNRDILDVMLQTDGAAVIDWEDEPEQVGVAGMQMKYYDYKGILRDTVIPAQYKDQQSFLPGMDVNKPFEYRTLFMPDTLSIDTFAVAYQEGPVINEVALKNNQYPVANAANDGSRWAILKDWISNDAVKNHNGYGGCDLNGYIYWEAGWGAPAIQNGKVYQMVVLPPGKYTFDGSVHWWYAGGHNYAYLVAASGNAGLPDISGLSSAIGSKQVDNGSEVKLDFELTQRTVISLGVLIDFGDDGEGLQFNSLRLYINH